MLEGRYSAEHPDVLRTRRDLDAVRAQLGTNIDLDQIQQPVWPRRVWSWPRPARSYTPESPGGAASRAPGCEPGSRSPPTRAASTGGQPEADNPVYIQIRAQRETLESQERSLVTKQAELRTRRDEIERKILQSSMWRKN